MHIYLHTNFTLRNTHIQEYIYNTYIYIWVKMYTIGVLMSACASTHTTPESGRTLSIPAREPRAMLWSPPRVSTKFPWASRGIERDGRRGRVHCVNTSGFYTHTHTYIYRHTHVCTYTHTYDTIQYNTHIHAYIIQTYIQYILSLSLYIYIYIYQHSSAQPL